jgi:hypothetical protein
VILQSGVSLEDGSAISRGSLLFHAASPGSPSDGHSRADSLVADDGTNISNALAWSRSRGPRHRTPMTIPWIHSKP